MKPALAAKRKLLWASDFPVPPALRRAAGADHRFVLADPGRPLAAQADAAPVAVLCPGPAAANPAHVLEQLNDVAAAGAVAVVLLPPDAQAAWAALKQRRGEFVCARDDASSAELSATLAAAEALAPAIRGLRRELAAAQERAAGAARTVEEVDEEMRLAARLQRDFLPQRFPEVDPVRFGVLFRPASWVSGDIYDVARLDESHIGLYVADAVGHGLPAALLTMFIKKALQAKRIEGHTYRIMPPELSLAELNRDICEQDLPTCQFCTAVYCVLDVSTLKLTYCCAGHPGPILFAADGSTRLLGSPGKLLGVIPDAEYVAREVRLSRGDRLLLYTDGAEDALCGVGVPGRPPFHEAVTPWARLPRDDMLRHLTDAIDDALDGAAPPDDMTVLAMDVAG